MIGISITLVQIRVTGDLEVTTLHENSDMSQMYRWNNTYVQHTNSKLHFGFHKKEL